jgi:hypothetical protein
VACALLVPGLALAQSKDKEASEPALPRLGLDPAEPSVRSAQPAVPFGIAPATSKEYVLDFHGYLLLPMQLGLQKREDPAGGSSTALHTPPLIPQDYRRFQYTGAIPSPWIQLNLSYGNSTVAGTVIIAAASATEGDAFYNVVQQMGISDAYVTLNLSKQSGIPLQIRGGATHQRYGVMGAFDSGRYATPLMARINSIGETATVSFNLGKSSVLVEQGIGSTFGRMPSGIPTQGWNDFGNSDVGSSYVSHLHGGFALPGLFQFGAHYITAWSQDDQNLDGTLKQGRITVIGADARLTAGKFGHLYAGVAHTQATNANVVSSIIEVLNTRGGLELQKEYLGPNSGGDGSLTTFGAQYDLSVARAMYGDAYRGNNPDLLFSLFSIGTSVQSDDPDYDGVFKLKGGAEVTYNIMSWFGASGRFDHVRNDSSNNASAFSIYTLRALFHTGWMSRDEFSLQYSHFVYGKEVYVANGYPPVDNPALSPDEDVFTFSTTFWW